jgi:hypothetical protein
MPADIAEQMCGAVEAWANALEGRRPEARADSAGPFEIHQWAIRAVEVNSAARHGDACDVMISRGADGHSNGDRKSHYPTIHDLASLAGISNTTFVRIRNAAKIELKLRGAAARNRRYTPIEVDQLIYAVLAGSFLERTQIARKWALWSSKAPDMPHFSK